LTESESPPSSSPIVEVSPQTAAGEATYRDFDAKDEEQILREMEGETVLGEMVYHTTIQGKPVTTLSYAGVKEAIRQRGRVEILSCDVTETEKEYRALVRARDHKNKIDVLGASTADKSLPFAYVLAINKAERNAFAKLIPAKMLASLVDAYQRRQRDREHPKLQPNQDPPVISEASLDSAELDRLPWQSMGKNPAGKWVFANVHGAELIVQRLRERGEDIVLGDWKYHLSIPKEGDQVFLNRFPHKDTTQSAGVC